MTHISIDAPSWLFDSIMLVIAIIWICWPEKPSKKTWED